MIMQLVNGFCMALADSVPGVSGGTIAFLMGFYDRFITSIDDLLTGNMEKKKNKKGEILLRSFGKVNRINIPFEHSYFS